MYHGEIRTRLQSVSGEQAISYFFGESPRLPSKTSKRIRIIGMPAAGVQTQDIRHGQLLYGTFLNKAHQFSDPPHTSECTAYHKLQLATPCSTHVEASTMIILNYDHPQLWFWLTLSSLINRQQQYGCLGACMHCDPRSHATLARMQPSHADARCRNLS